MDFLGVRIDRHDRVFGVALADRAREIFFDRNQFAEVDSAGAVNDPKPADAKHVLKPPLAQHSPGR